MMFCKKCGGRLNDNSKFCPDCGTPVTGSIEKPQTGTTDLQETENKAAQELDHSEQIEPSPVEVNSETEKEEIPPIPELPKIPKSAGSHTESAESTGTDASAASSSVNTADTEKKKTDWKQSVQDFAGKTKKSFAAFMAAHPFSFDSKEGIHFGKMTFKPVVLAAAAGSLALILLFSVVYMLFLKTPEIHLDKYIVFRSDGYSGYADGILAIDYEKLEQDYGSKLKYSSNSSIGMVPYTPVEYIKNSIILQSQSSEMTSNGDKIPYSMTASYWDDDALNYKVVYSNGDYTVKGLPDPEKGEVFELIEVSYGGSAPYGKAYVKENSDLGITTESFEITPASGLSNGDTVTFTLIDEAAFVNATGKSPGTLTKEFEVSGLSEYVTDFSDLPEEFKQEMISDMKDRILSYASKNFGDSIEIGDLQYEGYILYNRKNSSGNSASSEGSEEEEDTANNSVLMIQSAMVSDDNKDHFPQRVYFPYLYNNVTGAEEGYTYGSVTEPSDFKSDHPEYNYFSRQIKGYINPFLLYSRFTKNNENTFDIKAGDGFEQFAEYELVDSLSDISEGHLAFMRQEAKDRFVASLAEKVSSKFYESYSDPVFEGEYFLVNKNNETGMDSIESNTYIAVYSTNIVKTSSSKTKSSTLYDAMTYDGLIKMPEGWYITLTKRGLGSGEPNGDHTFYINGFTSLDELFNGVINLNRADYTFESSESLKQYGQ
jgi:hypothetical protein